MRFCLRWSNVATGCRAIQIMIDFPFNSEKFGEFDVRSNMLKMKAFPTVTDPKFNNNQTSERSKFQKKLFVQLSNDTLSYNDGILMHLPILVGCYYHSMRLFLRPRSFARPLAVGSSRSVAWRILNWFVVGPPL